MNYEKIIRAFGIEGEILVVEPFGSGHINDTLRVVVKEENEDEMENELLFQELCKILNIPCANYDIGLLNSNKYLISNSFLAL